MTQALSIVGQNFTPTPLQQAAIDRMEEFAGELKKAGFVMRSGIELEFMVKDKNSRITPVVLDIRAANARLAAMPGLRRFQGIKNEATAEYEIIVGEKVPQGLKTASVAQFSPVQVAATTAAAKRSLRGLLHSNTCLTPFARQERAPYSPMFAAYPHALAGQDHAASDDKTCALHVNASLYDLKGNNAFSADPSLQRQCAQQLVEVQH